MFVCGRKMMPLFCMTCDKSTDRYGFMLRCIFCGRAHPEAAIDMTTREVRLVYKDTVIPYRE